MRKRQIDQCSKLNHSSSNQYRSKGKKLPFKTMDCEKPVAINNGYEGWTRDEMINS